MREDLIERLRREADISARPGQMDRLNALADEFAAAFATQQPAAAHEPCAAVAAIQFALTDPEGMTFLRLWNEGDFDTLRREWPDALRKIYVGADPSLIQHQEPT